MNIHPSPTQSPLAPAEWTMNCSPANGGDGLCAYHYICTIFRKGVEMCRLSIANGNGASNEAVQLEAAENARAWIATFLLRPDEAEAFGRE